MTQTIIFNVLLIFSILLILYSLITRSSIGIVVGIILGLISVYFVFNLGKYPQFKNVKYVFDIIGEIFKNR